MCTIAPLLTSCQYPWGYTVDTCIVLTRCILAQLHSACIPVAQCLNRTWILSCPLLGPLHHFGTLPMEDTSHMAQFCLCVYKYVIYGCLHTERITGGQPGIISCITMHPTMPGTFALGSYSCSSEELHALWFRTICVYIGLQEYLCGGTKLTLVSLLFVGTKFSDFQIHDLVGINFGHFIISNSDTHQILSGFPTVSSNDEPSQKADL